MEFNYRFQINMLKAIVTYISYPEFYCDSQIASYSNNTVYQKYIEIPIDSNTIEIPCFCRKFVEETIKKNFEYPNIYDYKKVVVPLPISGFSLTKRTGDAIITSLYDNTDVGVKKTIDSKGNVYYGSRGLIMDKDFTPLLLTTISSRIETEPSKTIKYDRTNVRINPIVFDRLNDCIVEKTIVKKLINLYTNKLVESIIGTIDRNSDAREIKTAKVIIDDFSKFFVTPIKPKVSECNDEILNDLIIDNIGDII